MDDLNTNLIVLSLFGSVLLLLYGVRLAGDGLRGWAGPRIKTALETMTRNRFVALGTGVVVTFLLQSSSATTVTMVSLIDSGLISFSQTLGVILGSDIGTTITVQLISFKVHQCALFICGVGLFIRFITEDNQRKSLGEGILGFGLIFLSIYLMSQIMEPLQDNQLFKDILQASGTSPILGILAAMLITAIIQSSAATIGIVISLALVGGPGTEIIDVRAAIPLILGANIGTCGTALLSSLRSTVDAKRAAFANLLFKLIGVIIVLPFLAPFTSLMELTGDNVARQIANTHTIFNIGLAVILLPFTGPLGRLIEKWFPEKQEESDEFHPKYLNPAMLDTPSLALAQAARETMRMSEQVEDMLKLSLPALTECDLGLIERVEAMDDNVDMLDRSIRMYLTQLSRTNLTREDAKRQMEILTVISNLESIGDVIDKNIMELSRKKAKNCVNFSQKGQVEIEDLHSRILENFTLTLSAFTSQDKSMAEKVFRNKNRIRDLEKDYYRRHIERLESGLSESIETSSIHLDVLTNLKRINTHLTNIAYQIMESPDQE
ncbi:MAG: Na/Pi cotransporter family protein [bacterium]